MSVAADAVLAACTAVTASCALLTSCSARVRVSLDALISRDRGSCPPPRRVVLVIHDTDAVRVGLAHALSAALGIPVVEAATVAEARVALRRDRPAAIVADYHLGDETSAALLRERPPWSRATIVTARVDADALATIAAGCGARMLQTPVTDAEIDALVDAVRADLNASGAQ